MGSIFLLGGALMGVPPHHHGPALNSLVYGVLVFCSHGGDRMDARWIGKEGTGTPNLTNVPPLLDRNPVLFKRHNIAIVDIYGLYSPRIMEVSGGFFRFELRKGVVGIAMVVYNHPNLAGIYTALIYQVLLLAFVWGVI